MLCSGTVSDKLLPTCAIARTRPRVSCKSISDLSRYGVNRIPWSISSTEHSAAVAMASGRKSILLFVKTNNEMNVSLICWRMTQVAYGFPFAEMLCIEQFRLLFCGRPACMPDKPACMPYNPLQRTYVPQKNSTTYSQCSTGSVIFILFFSIINES